MQSSYFFLNGIRVHYLHWNIDSDGQHVVLLHGLGANARTWAKTAEHMAANGLAIWAPDLRGHGLTDATEDGYLIESFLLDLAAFIEAAHIEKPLLVGHNLGCLPALEYAARLGVGPRRPAGLALVDGALFQLNQAPDYSLEQADVDLAAGRAAGLLLEAFLAEVEHRDACSQLDDQDVQAILANYEINTSERLIPRLLPDARAQILRAMWEYPLYERFERVNCPALLAPARALEPQTQAERRLVALKEGGIQYIQSLRLNAGLESLPVRWLESCLEPGPLYRPEEVAAVVGILVRQ